MKKKNIIIGITLALSLSILTGCGKKAELKTDNKTAVKLKGVNISATDYYNELKKDSITKLLDMIDHKLFDEKYKTDEEETKDINSQIDNIKSYYKDNEDSYKAAIKQYFGVEDEDELRKKLSLEHKRKDAVNDYLGRNITDKEIKKYYDENVYGDIKASHILVSVKTTDKMSEDEKNTEKEKAYKKAKKIIKELDGGADFAKLAEKYSDDTATAKKGGDLGYFNSKEMDGGFWNGAYSLKKDKYSKEPVESSYGYHIILKKDEKKKKSLKKMKKNIKEDLAKDKLNSDQALFYKSLKAIREEKKITFGDSDLEKQYNDYMDDLISKANKSSNDAQ